MLPPLLISSQRKHALIGKLSIAFLLTSMFGGLSLNPANADSVTMAFSESSAPYAIESQNAGIDLDIIRSALELKGHTLTAVFLPIGRLNKEYEAGKVDALGTNLVFPQNDHEIASLDSTDGYYGNTTVQLQDVFISLADSNLDISTPESLSQYRVMAFQTARHVFKDWLAPVDAAKKYREISSQKQQLKMLLTDRVDVLLIEKLIIGYLAKQASTQGDVTVHPLQVTEFTPPLNYRPKFRSVAIRDDFNAGLETLRKTGAMKTILNKYADTGINEYLVSDES